MRLIRKEFKAWLEGFPSRKIVGQRGHDDSCPIAEFLANTKGVNYTSVGISRIHAGKCAFKTPEWARAFIREVDAGERPNRKRITAGAALRILEGN